MERDWSFQKTPIDCKLATLAQFQQMQLKPLMTGNVFQLPGWMETETESCLQETQSVMQRKDLLMCLEENA